MKYIHRVIFLSRWYHQVYIMGYMLTTITDLHRDGIGKKDTIKKDTIEEIELLHFAFRNNEKYVGAVMNYKQMKLSK